MAMSDWILEHGDDLQVIGFFGLLAILIAAERWAPAAAGPDGSEDAVAGELLPDVREPRRDERAADLAHRRRAVGRSARGRTAALVCIRPSRLWPHSRCSCADSSRSSPTT